ncbi:MAG: dicarboxylate/amino acid:cation symporter [Bacteroidales bacterium]|nr:dicarboxylate/amino acid:cation symporter [Bacteroidales bacterium]
MKKISIALHWQILSAIVLGALFGMFFYRHVPYIEWIGRMFLRALGMIVIPLIFSSLVMGMGNMGRSLDLGRIAGKTLLFFLCTTAIAATLGLFLVNIVKPGVGTDLNLSQSVTNLTVTNVSFIDQFVNIIPANLFEEMSKGNLLPVVFFAIVFGFFLTRTGDKTREVMGNFFSSFFDVMMKMTLFIIKFTPYGVFSLVACVIAPYAGDSQALLRVLSGLGVYTCTIWGGCLIHGVILLPGLVYLLSRHNGLKLIKKMSTPLLTAFSTCSSVATLPVALRDIQEKVGVSHKVASFVHPLGTTINMNGTALYECVTALFIAQAYGIDLTIAQQIMVVLTAILAAIGAASIPMAGLVMLAVVLGAVGLPLEGIGLVLAVQQLCDMARTSINAFGDACTSVIIAHSEGEKLNL